MIDQSIVRKKGLSSKEYLFNKLIPIKYNVIIFISYNKRHVKNNVAVVVNQLYEQ